MIELDGTPNKGALGANAILGVSLAVAHAARQSTWSPALSLHRRAQRAHAARPDDEYPQRRQARRKLHRPAGVHDPAGRRANLRRGAYAGARRSTTRSRRCCTTASSTPTSATKAASRPRIPSNREALDLIVAAIEAAGYRPGEDVSLGMDPAASEFYDHGKYTLAREGRTLSASEMIASMRSGRTPTRSSASRIGWPRMTGRAGPN